MDQVKIGKFIAQLRRQNNLTQEALGEKIGVTNKTVSRWETANYMPDIETLQMLSKEFGVSIHELLCGEKIREEDYRKQADENLVAVIKGEYFSKSEKYSFWKNKWLKDHTAPLIIYLAFAVAVSVSMWYSHSPMLNVLAIAAICVIGLKLRNDMSGYIEDKIYKP